MPAKVRDQLQDFKPLKIGGGGFLTGHVQHKDGTLITRTDTYGCYLWNEDDKIWKQLVTSTSMPKADVKPGGGSGVYEVAIAPTDSNIFYMCHADRVYRSNSRGKTWQRLALPKVRMDPNSGSRFCGHKMAVSPQNAMHVLVGTTDHGLFQSYDGGKSWKRAEDVALPKDVKDDQDPGVTGIIFDPTREGVIWAASHGSGYYRSEDNGKSWSLIGEGPTEAMIDCDISANGILYAAEHSGQRLWKNDGEWHKLDARQVIEQGAYGIACDPFNADRVVFSTAGGDIIQTLDAGATFSDIAWGKKKRIATSIPWLSWTPEEFMTYGDMSFHPTEKNRMMFSQGIGFWTALISDAPGDVPVDWYEMTNGIEQLVANEVIATPNGNVLVASWDRAIFKITNPDAYPNSHIVYENEAIVHCNSLDWCASDPDIIANVNFLLGSGVSRDGGKTFTPFETPGFAKDFGKGGGGGCIAVGGPDNYVWVGSNRQGAVYTKDGGQSWTPIVIKAIEEDGDGMTGMNFAYYLKRFNITADRVQLGTFYLWHASQGIFRSTDGGESWARVSPPPIDNSAFNAKLRSVPGHEGHLFATGGHADYQAKTPFIRSRTGGKTWVEVEGMTEAIDFGIGAVPPGGTYPSIWVVGYANQKWGIYRSDDDCKSWVRVSDGYPLGSIDTIACIEGDKTVHDRCYVGFSGSGYAYAPGGQKAEFTLPAPKIPAYMLLPAAAAYRFGSRWSALKARHNAFERELDMALETTAAQNPGWRAKLEKLRNDWKKL